MASFVCASADMEANCNYLHEPEVSLRRAEVGAAHRFDSARI